MKRVAAVLLGLALTSSAVALADEAGAEKAPAAEKTEKAEKAPAAKKTAKASKKSSKKMEGGEKTAAEGAK